MPSARRFTELGVQPKQRLTTLQAIEDTPREPAGAQRDDDPSSDPADREQTDHDTSDEVPTDDAPTDEVPTDEAPNDEAPTDENRLDEIGPIKVGL